MNEQILLAAAIALYGQAMVTRCGGVAEFMRPAAEKLAAQLAPLAETALAEVHAEENPNSETVPETPAESVPENTAENGDTSGVVDESKTAENDEGAGIGDSTSETESAAVTEDEPAEKVEETATSGAATQPPAETVTEAQTAETPQVETVPETPQVEETPTVETPAEKVEETPTVETVPANTAETSDNAGSTTQSGDTSDGVPKGVSDADLINILADKESKGRTLEVSIAAYLYGEEAIVDNQLPESANKRQIGYVKGLLTTYFTNLKK